MRRTRPPRGQGRLDGEIVFERVAKPGGGTRVLTRLGDRERLLFERVVAVAVPVVERGLASGVMANRARVGPLGLELRSWVPARQRYRRAVVRAVRSSSAAFVGDVLDCYASIDAVVVERALADLGASHDDIARVCAVLRRFEERGVRGLPVGPAPSAVLANAVLAPVDRAVREATGGPVLRWVDDVVAFAPGPMRAVRASDAFRRALEDLGLLAHPAKSRVVFEPQGLAAAASPASGVRGRARGMMRRP